MHHPATAPNPIKILVINPNTTQSMTDSLRAPIESLNYNNTNYTYLTSPPTPGGIPSINTPHDAAASATHTLPSILPHLPTHHAFLIACYSPHPLVPLLKSHTAKPVLGIFEASIGAAVALLRPRRQGKGKGKGGEEEEEDDDDDNDDKAGETFGIVSTGDGWKPVLEGAIRRDVLGEEVAGRVFAGVETCGIDAGELHGDREVEARVRDAARRLVEGSGDRLGAVILGCAGMVGMEVWVGEVVGEGVRVVDGVRAGVGALQGLVRGGF